MNVGILLPRLVNCGPVNMALTIVKALSTHKDINFHLILIHSDADPSLVTYVGKNLKIPVIFLDSHDRKKNLIKICHDLDAIHSHGFYPDKMLSNINIKKITTVHCMFYKDYCKEYGILKGFFGAFIHFYYLNNINFNYIVGCSKSVENYLVNKINKKNILSINNGVDQDVFKKIDKNESNFRRIENGMHVYEKIFVYAGRLIRRKRVPELIKIFNEKYSKNNLLIILGEGEELERCMRTTFDNVKFLGSVDNPHYYYQMADYVISNSAAEGYPMSILEAVSCGCFAILSDIPPHLEFIENNPNISSLIGGDLISKKINIDSFNTMKLSSETMASHYFELYMG